MRDCKSSDAVNDVISQPVATPRLPISILDHWASTQPERAYAFAPKTNDPRDGFEPISFGALARAVDHVAHQIAALRSEAKASDHDFPTVAYVGPNDVRYIILMLACVKAHCKAFFPSPRNSNAAMKSMFCGARPLILMYAQQHANLAHSWSSVFPVETLQVPPSDVWLQAKADPFPYESSWEEARWHPYFAVHTSGSTGIPKLVVVKQGSFGVMGLWSSRPRLQGARFFWDHWAACATRVLLFLPLCHMAALGHVTLMGLEAAVPFVFAPPGRPLTANTAMECIKASRVDSAYMAPSMIQDIAASPGGVEILAGLEFLAYGGGPLSPSVGDMLVDRGVNPCSVISSTEFSPYHIYHQSNPKLWNWFILNTESMGAEMREVEDVMEGAPVMEMVIHRIDEDPGLQTVFYTFPDKRKWSTGDLFRRHPTIPHHYQYVGRADDIIVLSNGLKFNPSLFERLVSGLPSVKKAMVVGNGRFQPALIVEPHELVEDSKQAKVFIESLWPTVHKANEKSPAYGKIMRHLISVSDPRIPLPQSAKGSLQRSFANQQYRQFIEDMYERVERPGEDMEATPLDLQSVEALTHCITETLATILGVSLVSADADLFNAGVDSLQVMNLSRHLLCRARAAGLAVDKDTIAPRVIYAHMTPRALAEHLFDALKGGERDSVSEQARETRALARLIKKYSADLPPPNPYQKDPLDDGQTIIVTGTTGSLGTYLLDRLVNEPRVSRIIALNRGSDGGASRQPAISASRGLSTDFSKVMFHGADLSIPCWGLGEETYGALLAGVDRIVHNAWPVNFNIGVESFEPSIRGVRHLIDFSNHAVKRVPIIFVSSVSTAMNWLNDDPVPEEGLEDLTLPCMGYGRSKSAASTILEAAKAQSGVCAASIRVGLIAGSRGPSGMWNKQEFMPSLVASSVYLGMLPDSIGPGDAIDWMPVEDVAGMILDVSGVSEPRPVSDISGYFNGVNPQTTTWSKISAAVRDFYGKRISRSVPLSDWVEALEKSAQESGAADFERNPGIKLIDTYRSFLAEQRAGYPRRSFATARTETHSSTMQRIGAIDGDLMKLWCGQWRY